MNRGGQYSNAHDVFGVQGKKLPFPNKWNKYYPYKETGVEQSSSNKLPKVGKGYKVGIIPDGSPAAILPSSSPTPHKYKTNHTLKMPQLVGSNSQSRLFQHVQRDENGSAPNSATRQARIIDQVLDDVFSPEKNYSKSP